MNSSSIKLFRFYKAEERHFNNIANNKLWLSRPDKFNDLDDCKIQSIHMPDLTPQDIKNLKQTIELYYPKNFNASESVLSPMCIYDLKEYIEHSYRPDNRSVLRRNSRMNSIQKELVNSVGICCFFSGNIANSLMWAHYADNHKGVCVEYEYTIDRESMIKPVVYSSILPSASARELALCPEETLTRIITSKILHWQYEKEYRLIELFPFNENEIGKKIDLPSYLKPLRIIIGDKFDKKMHDLITLTNLPCEQCIRPVISA